MIISIICFFVCSKFFLLNLICDVYVVYLYFEVPYWCNMTVDIMDINV